MCCWVSLLALDLTLDFDYLHSPIMQKGLFMNLSLPMMPWYLERHPEDQSLGKKEGKIKTSFKNKSVIVFLSCI